MPHIRDDFPKSFALKIGTVGIADEIETHAAGLEEYTFNAQPTPHAAQGDNLEQLLALMRQSAETVFQPLAVGFDVAVEFQIVQLAVEEHALAAAGDIGVRKEQLEVALKRTVRDKLFATEARLPCGSLRVAFVEGSKLVVLQFRDGLSKNLLIGLVAQVGDETALLSPEQIARAADVKVLHGDVYAATQVGEILNRLETTA